MYVSRRVLIEGVNCILRYENIHRARKKNFRFSAGRTVRFQNEGSPNLNIKFQVSINPTSLLGDRQGYSQLELVRIWFT